MLIREQCSLEFPAKQLQWGRRQVGAGAFSCYRERAVAKREKVRSKYKKLREDDECRGWPTLVRPSTAVPRAAGDVEVVNATQLGGGGADVVAAVGQLVDRTHRRAVERQQVADARRQHDAVADRTAVQFGQQRVHRPDPLRHDREHKPLNSIMQPAAGLVKT